MENTSTINIELLSALHGSTKRFAEVLTAAIRPPAGMLDLEEHILKFQKIIPRTRELITVFEAIQREEARFTGIGNAVSVQGQN